MCTALPQQVFARPGMTDRIERACAEAPAPRPAGPDRAQLLALLVADLDVIPPGVSGDSIF